MTLDLASPVVRIGALALAFSGGVFVGQVLTKRKYENEIAKSVEEAKLFYQAKYGETQEAKQEPSDVEQLVLDLGYVDKREPAQHTNYAKASKAQTPAVVVKAENVVIVETELPDGMTPRLEWDYETEVGERFPEIPYIIHRDEFENAQATGNSQVSFTYYEDDDVLVDESDSIIQNSYALIGEDTLNFGHGSGDANVVFVRNEKLAMDFEINLVRDSYAKSVMGLDSEPELKHYQQRRGRRSRDFD